MDLFLTARMKPASTFFAGYSAALARRLDDRGCSLLLYALGNTDLPSRYEISNALLDDDCPLGGPGSGGATVLHVLFAQVKHDIDEDTSLARRLIQRGADVNAPDLDGRLPFLDVLNLKFTDEQLTPLYDLWFEQPRLDFTTISRYGVNALDLAARLPYRGSILERMQRYVASET
ncbi:hypothetical protein [Microbacterium sp. Clip185]|uniref:hypothetical protein n=1 Tax=Microbacterium sp. Clip185 TaxID=3025663 RepID=UPI0023665339|nr:hypothetical protein [Microbacterium sp. Clip185]WDG16888.1 hypothetical protein PQV94_09540 [Microbacterium sp. Clip185]